MFDKIQEWFFTGIVVVGLGVVWVSEKILGRLDYEEQDYYIKEKRSWFKFKK
jgi:hypothetical protein